MQIATTLAQGRALFGVLPRPMALVPTMGALHEGHLELIRHARAQCVSVAASVFVNPLQFGPSEDLARYPRDPEGDRKKLAAAGVDVLFTPSVEAMYPPGFATTVDVGGVAAGYEGAARPHHFGGVATVVAKLLNVVEPDALYLGQKDAQQTAVLRQMVRDLAFPVRVEIVPTVRERDGLALSSRNAYLDAEQRAQAPALYRALQGIRDAMERGQRKEAAVAAARAELPPQAVPDYFDVVDADTFASLDALRAPAFVIGAVRFGSTRLLDNIFVNGSDAR
ncbi:MAG TPA: pantoate--beta-alanine ligase [Candidatus Acidoferrales bacterium]|nr:pantoate--beta-alanine ligase [Candidatus Acidoferrales bacterium]